MDDVTRCMTYGGLDLHALPITIWHIETPPPLIYFYSHLYWLFIEFAKNITASFECSTKLALTPT